MATLANISLTLTGGSAGSKESSSSSQSRKPSDSIPTGSAAAAPAAAFKLKPLEDVFSGNYIFDRYDDKLEDYLDSLGLSGRELGKVVRQTKIRIELKMPKNIEVGKWTLTTYEKGNMHYNTRHSGQDAHFLTHKNSVKILALPK